MGAFRAVHNTERFLVQFQGDPVHLLGGSLLQTAQEPVILFVMLLGISFPVGNEIIMGLGVVGHDECSS